MKSKFKIFLFLFLVFLFAAKGIQAYFEPGTGGGVGGSWEDSVYGTDKFNLQSSTNETFRNFIISANQQIFGPENETYRAEVGGGAIASVGNLIGGLYLNPPASATVYFADILHNLGLAKPAYAQGVGFTGLKPLLPLWKASRNLSYVFLIVAFLAMGFMIMFRMKISPQTVMTIQTALPRLVIALILITFSYAIVGLMIDLIYLIIRVAILALAQSLPSDWLNVTQEQAKYSTLTFGDGLSTMFGTTFRSIVGFTRMIIDLFGETTLIVIGLVAKGVGGSFKVSQVLSPLLIIGCIILYAIFKLFLSLLSSYISIILSLIFGPFRILMGVFPGKTNGFSEWFKSLLANVLVFPAVALMILIAWLLSDKAGPRWSPPVLGATTQATGAIISLGMILLMHKVPDMVKNAFGMKPAGFEKEIGAIIGGGYNMYRTGRDKLFPEENVIKESIKKGKVDQRAAIWRSAHPTYGRT